MKIHKVEDTTLKSKSVISLNSVETQNNSYTENAIEQVVKQKTLSFVQEQEFKAGDDISNEHYNSILSRLNPAEQAVMECVWTTLIDECYFDEVNGTYVLTELGQIAISDESVTLTEVVAHRIVKRVRELQVSVGSCLPANAYTHFYLGLSSAERMVVPDAWAELVNAGWFDPQGSAYGLTQLGKTTMEQQYSQVKQELKHKILQFAKACELKEYKRLSYLRYVSDFLKKLSLLEKLVVRDAWADLSDEQYFYLIDTSYCLTKFGHQAIYTLQ